MTTLKEKIFEQIEAQFADVVAWRRHLHQNPELSFQETETAAFVAEKLRSFGLEVKTNVGGNGVIAVLKGKAPGKTIAFRADIDALPIDDEKDVPYKSTRPGVMHACGHDGHTAALLGTARVLSDYRDHFNGSIVFIFQHAEELPPGGAKEIVKAGVLDDVDAVFGAHLASELPVGTVAVGSGYQMAAVDRFELTVIGRGGHGAKPHEAIDSIVVGSEIVHALQKIVSRRIDPLESAVVTVGVFQAGKAFNVIADRARIEGTVRTFKDDVRQRVEEEVKAIVSGMTKAYRATYELDYIHGYPALYNTEAESELVKKLLADVFREENVLPLIPSMGAEDFAYYLREKPGTFFRVGSHNEKEATKYPHHHPRFDFDERALLNIEKSFSKIALYYLTD